MLKTALTFLGDSPSVRRVVTGTGVTRAASRRFVAGETVDEFLDAAHLARNAGFGVIGNYLGKYMMSEIGGMTSSSGAVSEP